MFITRFSYLEAGWVAGDVEVLDGDLGIVAHLLSTVRTGRCRGSPCRGGETCSAWDTALFDQSLYIQVSSQGKTNWYVNPSRLL